MKRNICKTLLPGRGLTALRISLLLPFMALAANPTAMAQGRDTAHVTEPTDTLSPELKAALKLIESSNQLNATAIELVKATMTGRTKQQEPQVIYVPVPQEEAAATGATGNGVYFGDTAPVGTSVNGNGVYFGDTDPVGTSVNGNGVYFGDADPVGTSVNGVYFGSGVTTPATSSTSSYLPSETTSSYTSETNTPEIITGQGGSYVWVPDSLADRVNAFLLEPQQRLLFRDTAALEDMVTRTIEGRIEEDPSIEVSAIEPENDPEVLRTRNIGRFDRGLFNYRFIPKGQWAFGLTVSYGEFNTEDMELLSVMKDFDFGGHSFAIRPQLQYFLRNNLSIGLRFSYTQTKGNVGNVNMDFGDDLSFNIHDVSYNGESYAASFTFAQYLGLSRRGRFGVFNEAELAFSSGNSDFVRPFDGVLKTTHTTTTGVSLNYSPGLSVFMMKNASFNISFGVFGFSLKNEKQWVDGIESGNRLTSGINFRFNIFNIKFGLAIHI